ncbi:MAG TPA: hypothetical protein VGP58_06065 [Pyrinomonadaceae bacterium]|nr:hypothetical protein [Pyrinomonadaceae bacterium]
MKRSLFLIILISTFLCVANVAAQSPSKILKQANKVLGGEKVLQTVQSWQKAGKITRLKDNASGSFQMQTAQPNFYNSRFDLNGFETEVGYNGKSGWMRDSRDGLRTLTGEASRDFAAEANFRNARWLDYKKQKAKITSGGKANLNGNAANVLTLTTAKGVSIKMYFDQTTGLLIREEIPAGDLIKTFDYSDYQAVNGVNEPFTINAKIGEDAYEIKLEQVTHNQTIAEENFDFPKISGEPLPDIPRLLMELQKNEDKIDEILEDYSYTQKSIKRELGKDGVLRETESETFQLSFYKGNRIRRLIEKNGKPLSEKEQTDEDKNVQKRVAEIEREIAKKEARTVSQSANGTPDENNQRISTAEVLRASRLVNPRRERFRGRDVVVFDFEPNPAFDFRRAKSFLKFFGKTAGVMWIDEQDKQVARLEAFLFDDFKIGGGFLANLKKGASFALEQERVNDEIWLPSVADINLSVKVLLVKGINVNQILKSYNYRKFKTEVKDSKVDEIKNP